jgi:hypothetical protein
VLVWVGHWKSAQWPKDHYGWLKLVAEVNHKGEIKETPLFMQPSGRLGSTMRGQARLFNRLPPTLYLFRFSKPCSPGKQALGLHKLDIYNFLTPAIGGLEMRLSGLI